MTRMGLPAKTSPKAWKTVEKWVRYTQFRWFSWNWLYLIQFSTKKHVLGLVLKVAGRRIVTRTHTRRYPYPWPVWVWKTRAFPYSQMQSAIYFLLRYTWLPVQQQGQAMWCYSTLQILVYHWMHWVFKTVCVYLPQLADNFPASSGGITFSQYFRIFSTSIG